MFSKATMNIFLERPSKAYFGQAKSTYAKQKMRSELSQEAYNFFKMFLDNKLKFERPSATAYYRPYEVTRSHYMEWPSKSWIEETIKCLSLGVIDFRSLPGVEKKETSTIENPFFFEVLSAMQKTKKLALEDFPLWLFICGDEKEAQVTSFVESNTILKTFLVDYSLYSASKNDPPVFNSIVIFDQQT